jgi:hypothetical protein
MRTVGSLMRDPVRRTARALGVAVAVVGMVTVRYVADHTDGHSPQVEEAVDPDPEFDFVVPPGTAERIAAGEEVEILPGEIAARVGDTIRIDNRDSASHTLGPWYVAPGEVLTQRFVSEGRFSGMCNVHRSGQLKVVVEA